jgi:endonuclease/exonuclease/phosphatase (EEP) superfamily protein YafD
VGNFRLVRSMMMLLGAAAAFAFAAAALARTHGQRVKPVTVMTYNVFQGTELSHTLTAKSASALPAAVAADYTNVIKSKIPARARAIAAEIKAHGPALVGLQEAVLWRTQSPPPNQLVAIPGTATTVSYDFVKLLVRALARLGLHYRAVAITDNIDAQVNASFPNGRRMAVRYTDRVAILARSGVRISHVREVNFNTHDNVDLLGAKVPVPDGYAAVDALIGGRTIRFITSHLDGLNDANSNTIRAAEAKEVLDGPAHTGLPVVFTCDCNATPGSPVHRELTAVGLRDKWHALNPHQRGLTCCHRKSPRDLETDVADPHPRQGIVERLDYIWSSHKFTVLSEHTVGLNRADRTKTRPRLWPSDHLGLVAELLLL